jgi:hypothetical protein
MATIVNDKDAAILAAHWGQGIGEESVPEPGSLGPVGRDCRDGDGLLARAEGVAATGQHGRRESRPQPHLKDFAQHIGTKDLSRAAHHVRRAERAGLMRKIGWVGGWVVMTPEVSVSLFRRASRVMTSPARL